MHTVTHVLLHASPLLIYGIVVVILLLESTAIPIANNTLLLCTGALASLGRLNIWLLFVVALMGSIAGACVAYSIGVRGGRGVLLRLTTFLHLDVKKVEVVERWFMTSGLWMVFLSRMTPYVRPFACFPAGISRMPFPRFFAAASVGSCIWCAGMLLVGWYLGKRWIVAVHLMQHYTPLALLAIVLVVTLCFGVSRALKHYLNVRYQPSNKRD